MKLFTAEQIRDIDSYTIKNEPIKSISLMERAASAMFGWFIDSISKDKPVHVFCGPGNNGGDGLALARMLCRAGYSVSVCFLRFTENISADCTTNLDRLGEEELDVCSINDISEFPEIFPETVIVDAIFGTGLSRPAEGLAAAAIKRINMLKTKVVSLDIPSGLFSEDNGGNDLDNVIKADITLTLQFPKISFLFPEADRAVGKFIVLPIGLHPLKIESTPSSITTTEAEYVLSILHKPQKFDHKGINGHGLLVSGSCGKIGASVLGARAALRTGIGLLTVHVPRPASDIIHNSVPEAMVQCDQSEVLVSEVYDVDKYKAIAIGPGIGTKPNTVLALEKLIRDYKGPMVLDADALNILSANKNLFADLPPDSILTPHPGEFERMAGKYDSSFVRIQKQKELAVKTACIVILKGANTSIAFPDGKVCFNTTGNPGMATAGSGDVLSGILLALLAKGYKSSEAAVLGVYLHGLAGDIAVENSGPESLIASDIIDNIGKSYIKIRKG